MKIPLKIANEIWYNGKPLIKQPIATSGYFGGASKEFDFGHIVPVEWKGKIYYLAVVDENPNSNRGLAGCTYNAVFTTEREAIKQIAYAAKRYFHQK